MTLFEKLCTVVLIISTHTLTWSVTHVFRNGNLTRVISTHTLTWSVTTSVTTIDPLSINFNSHAHVERDQDNACADVVHVNFNSHAHVERDGTI